MKELTPQSHLKELRLMNLKIPSLVKKALLKKVDHHTSVDFVLNSSPENGIVKHMKNFIQRKPNNLFVLFAMMIFLLKVF